MVRTKSVACSYMAIHIHAIIILVYPILFFSQSFQMILLNGISRGEGKALRISEHMFGWVWRLFSQSIWESRTTRLCRMILSNAVYREGKDWLCSGLLNWISKKGTLYSCEKRFSENKALGSFLSIMKAWMEVSGNLTKTIMKPLIHI